MKRTFEITYDEDAIGPDGITAGRIDATLRHSLGACGDAPSLRVKDVTPPSFYPCPICARRTPAGTVCEKCYSNISAKRDDTKAVAQAVVAESLEKMAKPYALLGDKKPCRWAMDHDRFAREARRLRAALEPTLTRGDCGKAARDDPPYANCPCFCPRQCAWAEARRLGPRAELPPKRPAHRCYRFGCLEEAEFILRQGDAIGETSQACARHLADMPGLVADKRPVTVTRMG